MHTNCIHVVFYRRTLLCTGTKFTKFFNLLSWVPPVRLWSQVAVHRAHQDVLLHVANLIIIKKTVLKLWIKCSMVIIHHDAPRLFPRSSWGIKTDSAQKFADWHGLGSQSQRSVWFILRAHRATILDSIEGTINPPSHPPPPQKSNEVQKCAIFASSKWGGGVVQMFHLLCPR